MSTEAPPPLAPAPRRSLLWLWLTLGAVALVLLACGTAGVLFVVNRSNGGAKAGDVALTVQVRDAAGAPVSSATLDHVRQVLLSRLTSAGLARPIVTITGADTLRVTVGPKDGAHAKSLLVPGGLTIRQVIGSTPSRGSAGCTTLDPSDRQPSMAEAVASAKAKLGPQWDFANGLDSDVPEAAQLTGFEHLTCTEIAALPVNMQYFVPTVTCAMLNARPPDAIDGVPEYGVACDEQGTTKYRVGIERVTGPDIADATARDNASQNGWLVDLRFTSGGQQRWTQLTRDATGQQVAIALDDLVLSAPQIQEVITGDAVIAGGGIDEAQAKGLAAAIRYGTLPVTFTVLSIEQVR